MVASLVFTDPLIDDVLGSWAEQIGRDLPGYRGHVYRTFNFARALSGTATDTRDLALAAAFHDLGIWAERTFDYLEPSALHAESYVAARQPLVDAEALRRTILLHHKLTSCERQGGARAEAFRRADLVDLSLGLIDFGLPSGFIREVRAVFPNAGFHRCLLRLASGWAFHHPTRPLPMLSW
jgi:hypothetical protein